MQHAIAFLEESRVVQRDTLMELCFRQFNQVSIVRGNSVVTRTVKNQINAVDLSADKNGFRIIIGDDNPGLGEQKSRMDLISDAFRQLAVALDECLFGAIHEVKADLQRRMAAPFR